MIRVLVVDDSAIVRKVLTEELSKFKDIDVIAGAMDPYVARDKIVKLRPDVITLDIEMPRMDGLSFLAKLMKFYPMPVVVLSSVTQKNSKTALRALDLGAVEVVSKPSSSYSTPEVSHHLVRAIRAAASAKLYKYQIPKRGSVSTREDMAGFQLKTTHKVVAIGASTGGTKAIETVLRNLPTNAPGNVIVQHMPENFTASFAARLNEICPMTVREARNNDYVTPGLALIAPGNRHMILQKSGATYQVKIKDGPAVHHQRPSVDVLFQSVATSTRGNAVGILLTGMGADGAKGLLRMRESGAYTIVQDEESSIVFGMPKEAIKIGAAHEVLPVQKIAEGIINATLKHS